MPRKLRMEYAGALYHIMSRGDRRRPDNPVRAGLLKTEDRLVAFRWTGHS